MARVRLLNKKVPETLWYNSSDLDSKNEEHQKNTSSRLEGPKTFWNYNESSDIYETLDNTKYHMEETEETAVDDNEEPED